MEVAFLRMFYFRFDLLSYFQYTDEEVERSFEEFYEDVHTEFLKFGEIVNFKVIYYFVFAFPKDMKSFSFNIIDMFSPSSYDV